MPSVLQLRSEVTGGRMEKYEHELLSQELKGAKDTVAAMEARAVDLLCPLTANVDQRNMSRLEQQKELWTYTSLMPYTTAGYNNLRLDNTLLQARPLLVPPVVGGPCQRGDPHAARRGVCGAGARHTSRRHVRYASPP